MIPANKLYYLSQANDNIAVLMQKAKASHTYKFYDSQKQDDRKLKIALFTVKGSQFNSPSGVVVCYELESNGVIIAEDTSNVLHPNIVPGLIAAIFFDVFG